MTFRPSCMVKFAAITPCCTATPNGTCAKPQKNPGKPSHGVSGKTPGNPEIVKNAVPKGKKRLTKMTSMMLPDTKNNWPGVKTENPGGKNPKRPKPNHGQPA